MMATVTVKEAGPTPRQLYRIAQANCGLNTGDWVKVLRRAKNEEDGWRDDWIEEDMGPMVGNEYKVVGLGDYGVKLEKSGAVTWNFPYFVLERVEAPLFVNGHRVHILEGGDKVCVGCVEVEFRTVFAVNAAIQEYKKNSRKFTLPDSGRTISFHTQIIIGMDVVKFSDVEAIYRRMIEAKGLTA
jgi:hypothetical protein